MRQLASFLERGGFPSLTHVTAEHIREWLNELTRRSPAIGEVLPLPLPTHSVPSLGVDILSPFLGS